MSILNSVVNERDQNMYLNPYQKINFLPLELITDDAVLLNHFINTMNVSKRVYNKVGIKPLCVIPLSVFDSLANSTSGEKVWEWMIDLRNISNDRTVPLSINGAKTFQKVKTNSRILLWRNNCVFFIMVMWFILAIIFQSILFLKVSPIVWFISGLCLYKDERSSMYKTLKKRVIDCATWPTALLTQYPPKKGSYNYWVCRPCGKGQNSEKVYKDYLSPSDRKAKLFFKDVPKHFEESFDKVVEAKLQPCILSAPGMIGLMEESMYKKHKGSIYFENFIYNTDPVLYLLEEEHGVKYAACLDYYGEVEEQFIEDARKAYGEFFNNSN